MLRKSKKQSHKKRSKKKTAVRKRMCNDKVVAAVREPTEQSYSEKLKREIAERQKTSAVILKKVFQF